MAGGHITNMLLKQMKINMEKTHLPKSSFVVLVLTGTALCLLKLPLLQCHACSEKKAKTEKISTSAT